VSETFSAPITGPGQKGRASYTATDKERSSLSCVATATAVTYDRYANNVNVVRCNQGQTPTHVLGRIALDKRAWSIFPHGPRKSQLEETYDDG
jgi:hypothetical protein